MTKKTEAPAGYDPSNCVTDFDVILQQLSEDVFEVTGKMPNKEEAILLLQAFLLDVHIEEPERIQVVTQEGSVRLYSDILKRDSTLLRRIIEERADIGKKLVKAGWEMFQ